MRQLAVLAQRFLMDATQQRVDDDVVACADDILLVLIDCYQVVLEDVEKVALAQGLQTVRALGPILRNCS